MQELFNILSFDEKNIDMYIDKRLSGLNAQGNKENVAFENNIGSIWSGWLNTDTTYFPSGNRSKGFKIDKEVFKDFVKFLKANFGSIPMDKLRKNLNEDILLIFINNYFAIEYFGHGYDEFKRKGIYGYGSLNSIGKTINLSELKGQDVSRCIEKSAALNAALQFLGMESSLVVSMATQVSNEHRITAGHAYCLVNTNDKSLIVDPNDYGVGTNGKVVFRIFELDKDGKECYFDPAQYGDYESEKIIYDFPYNKLISRGR